MVADLSRRRHTDADGRQVRYTARTLCRWLARWRAGGFEALKPQRRRDAGSHRVDDAVLELAAALRREAPARSAAHIAEIIKRDRGAVVTERTLQRFLAAQGLDRARLEGRVKAFGRFEAAAFGDLWTADGWDGPAVAELHGRHAQLLSIIDDHARLLPHGAFYPDVSEWSFLQCLRSAIGRRDCVPYRLYADNGSSFSGAQLQLICARLGIRVVHSRPYTPQGRGKKERLYRTVAEQFGVEVGVVGVATLAELNSYWTAWVEQSYHRRVHTGTGQTPLERWQASADQARRAPDPAALSAAFRWSAQRVVTATATVSLYGNHYRVDESLVGWRVELRYDPADLTVIEVYRGDTPCGHATPEHIDVHVHPKLAGRVPTEPGPPTGIRYLDALVADHAADLQQRLSYQQPPLPLDLPDPHPDDPDHAPDDGGDDTREAAP